MLAELILVGQYLSPIVALLGKKLPLHSNPKVMLQTDSLKLCIERLNNGPQTMLQQLQGQIHFSQDHTQYLWVLILMHISYELMNAAPDVLLIVLTSGKAEAFQEPSEHIAQHLGPEVVYEVHWVLPVCQQGWFSFQCRAKATAFSHLITLVFAGAGQYVFTFIDNVEHAQSMELCFITRVQVGDVGICTQIKKCNHGMVAVQEEALAAMTACPRPMLHSTHYADIAASEYCTSILDIMCFAKSFLHAMLAPVVLPWSLYFWIGGVTLISMFQS